MNIGIIGLGRMGGALAFRLARAGHQVIGFDFNEEAIQQALLHGVSEAKTVAEVGRKASIIWLMVPAGDPVDAVIEELLPNIKEGSIIVDGGNSNFTDSIKRAHYLKTRGIYFVDCGTSGGLFGRDHGFCLMIGGERSAYEQLEPFLKSMATENGYAYIGSSGSGHYVKMIHNGVEYALMEAYAEGFHLIKEGSFKDEQLNLEAIAGLWNSGSIIRSWLLSLTHDVLKEDQKLDSVSGFVAETGMGMWTQQEAQKNNVSMPALDTALAVRNWSRKTGGNYTTKLIAMMRNKMGGHLFKKVE